MQKANIEVWDPALRLFHWLLVASFASSWWSEGRDIRVHVIAGTTMAGLLVFRLIWGVIGTHHARFASFRPSLAEIVRHARHLLNLKGEHYAGHTPIGSIMIYLLLTNLLLIALTGTALAGLQLGTGSLAGITIDFRTETQIALLHAWLVDFTLGLIAIHLAGVIVESLLQQDNLIMAMIHGKKQLRRNAS